MAFSIIGIALIILHIKLSKNENKNLGLIIPCINVGLSILAVIGAAFFMGVVNLELLTQSITIFITYNISTLILMAIYFACRKKINTRTELEKMNLQDLN